MYHVRRYVYTHGRAALAFTRLLCDEFELDLTIDARKVTIPMYMYVQYKKIYLSLVGTYYTRKLMHCGSVIIHLYI